MLRPVKRLIETQPFWAMWIAFALLRTIHLTVHYLRYDPYDLPIVARIDRFLPFAIVADLGAIFLVLLPGIILFQFIQRSWISKISFALGSIYLLYGVIDLEVYRHLRQHLSFAYIKTYFRPSLFTDSTFLLVAETDPIGNAWFLFFSLSLVVMILLSPRFSSAPRTGSVRVTLGVFSLLGSLLIASPYWLNPSVNRRNQIAPPLMLMAKDVYQTIKLSTYTVEAELNRRVLSTFGHLRNDSSESVSISNFPFIHFPDHFICPHVNHPSCGVDQDADGFTRTDDCNDNDSDSYPGAAEIPSDGRDQDCNGIDASPVNIVLLVVESLHRELFWDAWSEESRLTNFKRLQSYGGTLFKQAFANGFPSVDGAASIYLGLWNPPGHSIFGEFAGRRFRGFPKYLEAAGYARHIVTGADPYFDNQAPWFHRYYDAIDFDKSNGNTDRADEIVFRRASDWLQAHSPGEPYLLTINNHSTHSPFRVPSDFEPEWTPKNREESYQKALQYFDRELGKLLDTLEQRPDFERTVILVIGDHGFPIQSRDFELPQFYGYQKTEMVAGVFSKNQELVGAPSVDTTRVVAQVDVGPTVLDLLGIDAPHHFQGQSWLLPSRPDAAPRHALFFKNDTFALHSATKSDYGLVDEPRSPPSLAPDATNLADLLAYTIHQDRVWEPLLLESPKRFFEELAGDLHWPVHE